ncbi:uroporphyrin-III C-methyltransferase [Janthinobacterium sp. Marseille]|uniref:Uroporphyrin-III C-methyltransferase n=2 Tax=Herminiimonas TaxID=303379 RepID=A4G2Y3_HERAR|nr:DUF488 family protein [Janthinobacterium sp. Marseille]ABR91549.1 uroporphyrin-III C-methyltransferase [Janthinobacterium sp. Marseille]CAL60870.1 conserved hypothetical protein [Herminiimonas arsenicoxydans]
MSNLANKPSVISIRRAYEDPSENDGYRVLVDRLWPRGRSKESLKLDQWARELAPTDELRKWFGHEPQHWEVFQQRYRSELAETEKLQQMQLLLADAAGRSITLVYGAKDEQHNQAVVLRDVMSKLLLK